MQTVWIYIIVYQLAVLHGDQIFYKKDTYAQIGSEVILLCNISKETSQKSWRKGFELVTRGLKINRNVRGQGRLKVITDTRFYNLKISNITKYDFGTYWCEKQHGSSISAEGTKLIYLVASTVNLYEDTTIDILNVSFQSTLSDSPTSDTGISHSFFYWLFATGFAVLCLSVGCNFFINKLRVAIAKRKEQNLNGNGHQNMLKRNGTNNTTANNTALEENDNVYPHYETINENEIIEMFHPAINVNLSNIPSSKRDLEDTNSQRLNQKRKTKREKNDSKTHIFLKSVSSYSSEQSEDMSVSERYKKANEHPNKYLTLNVNEMEYLNSYSTPMTENN